MTLTLLYRRKNTRLVYNVQLRDLFLVVAVLLVGIGWLIANQMQQTQLQSRLLNQTQSGLIEQQQQLQLAKQQAEQQLTGMVLKLADMQSQMQRLNALGSRLVDQAQLAAEEFNFDELPAIGGPAQETALDIQQNFDFLRNMDDMLAQIENKSQQLEALESIMLNHHIDEQSYLAGRPIRSGWLSSHYGVRKDPFSGLPAMHHGLDFAGKSGDPVVATGAGLVTWSGERYGYGNLIEVDHGDGLVTRYGHNRELKVKVGDVVTKGQTIGLMGNTGRSTGAHVHYEVLKNGKQIDPLPFVYRKTG